VLSAGTRVGWPQYSDCVRKMNLSSTHAFLSTLFTYKQQPHTNMYTQLLLNTLQKEPRTLEVRIVPVHIFRGRLYMLPVVILSFPLHVVQHQYQRTVILLRCLVPGCIPTPPYPTLPPSQLPKETSVTHRPSSPSLKLASKSKSLPLSEGWLDERRMVVLNV
jgi:hypothetical protein